MLQNSGHILPEYLPIDKVGQTNREENMVNVLEMLYNYFKIGHKKTNYICTEFKQ